VIGLVTVTAALAVYFAALAWAGFRHGEAPGRLKLTMDRLRGERPAKRYPWWWSEGTHLTRRQRLGLTAVAGVVLAGCALALFRSWTIALVLLVAAPLYPQAVERSLRTRRRDLLTVQFGLALQAMAASLRAGASLRTAVERATADLERMLAGQPLRPMVVELERVVRDMQMGFSLEEALIRFRDRLGLEDVTDFVGAVLLCRVRGGNVAVVMASIAEIIQDKITVRQQIQTLTAGKRMEGNMIIFAPPVMVVLLGFTAPGYLTPLYERLTGQVMLIVGIGLLVAAYLIGRRLLEIEI